VPQPQGLIGAAAGALASWWFLLRRRAQVQETALSSRVPSRSQRFLAIVAYSALNLLVIGALGALVMSQDCLVRDRCTSAEGAAAVFVGILFLVVEAVVLILGWRRRLPGLRRRPPPTGTDRLP